MSFRQDGNRHVYNNKGVSIELIEHGTGHTEAEIKAHGRTVNSRYRSLEGAKKGSTRMVLFLGTLRRMVRRVKGYRNN